LSVYAETSFLVSLYIFDANSARVASQMRHVKLPILLTPLGEIELANALYLRLFRKELVSSKINAAHSLFVKDIAGGIFELRSLSQVVYDRAKLIARKQTPQFGTRTLDVLHVASALVLKADAFYTFDRNQEKLAQAEGLTIA